MVSQTETVSLGLASSVPESPTNATLTSRIHDILETAIITGALKPGERIHADALAAQYGMSRIPVREALRSLNEAGWVEIKPRHGVHVRERTLRELDELFEFRALIEARVARWAAERRSESDLIALQASVRASKKSNSDPELAEAVAAFYHALRGAARNSVLEATSASLEKRARFYFSTVAHELGQDWTHVHEKLLDRIKKQQPDEASAVAQQHIEDTGRAVRVLLFPDG